MCSKAPKDDDNKSPDGMGLGPDGNMGSRISFGDWGAHFTGRDDEA